MEWSIGELAERAGISARTLRHYDHLGLLAPSRSTQSGLRYYDVDSVARLQRILLLRATGMSLRDIGALLDGESMEDEMSALQLQAQRLEAERNAINAKLVAVQHVLDARRDGRDPNPDVILAGFNDRYEEEVVQRWGRVAYEAANDWWHGKNLFEQQDWKQTSEQLVADWAALAESGAAVGSPEAVEMVRRHVEWLGQIPGTPTHAGDVDRSLAMIGGLARMYVQDPSFRHSFGGYGNATFVHDALLLHASRVLGR